MKLRNNISTCENGLIIVSFGTSFPQTREKTIGAIEHALEKAFPDYFISRAFTSGMVIKRIRAQEGIAIDTVSEAMKHALQSGVRNLILQPTHLMHGREYQKLKTTAAKYADRFQTIAVGLPLLDSDEDFQLLMQAITEQTSPDTDDKTAVCFMGHGTDVSANEVYAKLQALLHASGFLNYYIGTVEGTPTLDDVIKQLNRSNYRKVILQPLMIVAGDHACNDMAGDGADSWKSIITSAGYQVECILSGLGENPNIHDMFVRHTQLASEQLRERKASR